MSSYSLFTIFLLCLAIVLVDILAFYWLQSIKRLLESYLKTIIHILFYVFSSFFRFCFGRYFSFLSVAIHYMVIRIAFKFFHPYSVLGIYHLSCKCYFNIKNKTRRHRP